MVACYIWQANYSSKVYCFRRAISIVYHNQAIWIDGFNTTRQCSWPAALSIEGFKTRMVACLTASWITCIWQPWWRYQMETFSALLAIWAVNSPVTGEFPTQKPVTRSYDVFFDLGLNKRVSKQSRGWWFETPSHVIVMIATAVSSVPCLYTTEVKIVVLSSCVVRLDMAPFSSLWIEIVLGVCIHVFTYLLSSDGFVAKTRFMKSICKHRLAINDGLYDTYLPIHWPFVCGFHYLAQKTRNVELLCSAFLLLARIGYEQIAECPVKWGVLTIYDVTLIVMISRGKYGQ